MTLFAKPPTCLGCDWRDVGRGYAGPSGPKNAKLAVIAESAGENEARDGKPLVGATGQMLNRTLKAAGIDRVEVYCDNVVRCQPPPQPGKKKKIPQRIIDYCTSVHLDPELRARQPQVVIAMGEYSTKHLTGRTVITKQRGSVIHQDTGPAAGAIVVPTIHYAAFTHGADEKRNRQLVLKPFVDYDITKAVGFINNPPERFKENYELEPSVERIVEYLATARVDGHPRGVDIETSGGMWWNTAVLCIGLYDDVVGHGLCIPLLGQFGAEIYTPAELGIVVEALYDYLYDENAIKIKQNGNYDTMVLESHGFVVRGFDHDTMIDHHIAFCERGVPHDLGFIGTSCTYIPYGKDEVKGADNFALLDPRVLRHYNLTDCAVTAKAKLVLQADIDELQSEHIRIHDMKKNHAVRRMMVRGIRIDTALRDALRKQSYDELADLEQDLRDIVGSSFNPNSDHHVRRLLFDDLGIKPSSYTLKTRQGKVDFDALVAVQESFPRDDCLRTLFDVLIARNKLETDITNFLGGRDDRPRKGRIASEIILDDRGILHTRFSLHIVPSGRLSSADPNLQNIPSKFRRMFIARPGYEFIERDKSQVELRIYAYGADDDVMIAVFEEGRDPHRESAADLFRVAAPQVNPNQRHFAKTFHYGGILYAGGPGTIRAQAIREVLKKRYETRDFVTEVYVPSVNEIDTLVKNWFMKHPRAALFNAKIEDRVRAHSVAESMILRRKRNFCIPMHEALRAARSHTVSGTAADMIDLEFIDLDRQMCEADDGTGFVLQLHDAFLIETPKGRVNEWLERSAKVMHRPYTIGNHTVVYPTDAKRGTCWGEMEKIK